MREKLEQWQKEKKLVCIYFVNEVVIGRYKAGYIIAFDDKEESDKGIIFHDRNSGAKMTIPFSSILAISEFPTP